MSSLLPVTGDLLMPTAHDFVRSTMLLIPSRLGLVIASVGFVAAFMLGDSAPKRLVRGSFLLFTSPVGLIVEMPLHCSGRRTAAA